MKRFEWRAFAFRALLLAGLFWVVAEGRPGVLYAAVTVVLAAAASLALLPARRFRVRPVGLFRFAPWFVGEAVRGGLDVAARAIRPDLPLRPGYLEYETRLSISASRVFFVNAVSLLPGTLSVGLSGNVLRVHALDVGQPLPERLRRLEERVAAVFAAPFDRGSRETLVSRP